MEFQNRVIPAPVIQRLPRYYFRLSELSAQEVGQISSTELAKLMQTTSSQVRLDLSYLGNLGRKGYGYNVRQLMRSVGNALGVYQDNHLIVIGAGKLGQALLRGFPFSQFGFTVDAAFDAASGGAGDAIAGVPVYPLDRLEEFLGNHPVQMAALTISPASVEALVDRLIQLGVVGFWNFTSQDLTRDDPDITFENIHLADSLLRLNYRMRYPQSSDLGAIV
jgi:redox-sensing transcriptional repressor